MFFTRKTVPTLLAGSALCLGSTQATAQESSPTSTQNSALEEVVVTAQKRSERLMDVPLSITAASGEQLSKQGITDTSQLTKVVPGFTYQESNYGTPVFTIRGVGFFDGAAGAGPTVTTYIDQVPLPYSMLTRGATLDLERVEVLKGPQGTLFGQNSTGGAINYIAAKPTAEFAAGATVSYGRFDAVDAEGFVSGPLTDTLRMRVALRSESADGWQKSLTRPGDRFGKKEFYNGRLLLDWEPIEALSFELNVSGWKDKSEIQAAQLQAFAPSQPATPFTQFIYDALSASPIRLDGPRWADWTPGTRAKDNDFYMTSLRGDWHISEAIDLSSITAFSKLVGHMPVDTDGSAFNGFYLTQRDVLLKSFSQELRLAGTAHNWKWMFGGNYQRDVADEFTVLSADATNGVAPTPAGLVYQNRSAYSQNQQPTAKAVFASVDYDLTHQVTAQLSARYTKENRDFDGCLTDAGPGTQGVSLAQAFLGVSELLSGTPSTIGPGGCLTLNDTTLKPERAFLDLNEHNLSWRGSLNWKPADNSLLYISAAKGWKSGAFSNVPGLLASEFHPITQESVMSVEAGAKYGDRRAQISGAIFHYNYDDKQLIGYVHNTLFGNLPKLVNIPKSRVWGAEVELTASPVERLRIQAGVSYVNSRVQSDPAAPALPLDPYGSIVSFVGEAFPNTPKWQLVGDAEYGIPLSGTAQAFIGGSVSYRGKSNAAFGERPEFALPSYALIDLRAGVEWDNWRAQIWGRNVTNKYYWVNVSHLVDVVARFAGTPATYGITLAYRF